MRSGRGIGAAALAVASRPRLWGTAMRQARVLIPPRWWARRPFLPLPDRDWLAFRLTTAYGDPSAPMHAGDLVVWLEWSRRQHRLLGETPGSGRGGHR